MTLSDKIHESIIELIDEDMSLDDPDNYTPDPDLLDLVAYMLKIMDKRWYLKSDPKIKDIELVNWNKRAIEFVNEYVNEQRD